MPFVVTDNDVQSTRKRRRDDDEHSSIHRPYEQDRHQDHYLLNAAQDFGPSRRVLPLSSKPKRARITSSSEDENSNIHCLGRDGLATAAHRRRPSQQKIPPDQQPNIHVGGKTPFRPTTAAVLAPCYICHRRPTKKSDLDSFAQCEGCGEVACFVCVRLCHGWNEDDGMSVISEQEMLSRSFHMGDADDMTAEADGEPQHHEADLQRYEQGGNGEKQENEERRWGKGWAASGHRSVVCSRCCVERGRQGEVVCLGCLSGMPGA
ncbi:hypothetical protein C2857_004374 [Epichloe festucae Fl1]|uniref:Uncharacterized protein n=1 Tax=Epichloe festucae (strain Fl1) TaxID=877507 RepID=A0A7S9KSB9_EPIFF|nr:hypothetical protein C2857_004374 [Epichloe festucae Fl1]